MDPEGARALARRIAEGKPTVEIAPAKDVQEAVADGPVPAPEPPRTRVENGVVYIHARRVRAQRQVWVYVRGTGEKLQRAR
jgi:hypothetical protein